MNINREKNVYTIILDNGKKIVMDTNEKYTIGVSGKRIKTNPIQIGDLLIIGSIFENTQSKGEVYNVFREYIDRLISLPIGTISEKDYIFRMITKSGKDAIDNISEYWRVILKTLKNFDYYKQYFYYGMTLANLRFLLEKDEKLKKYNMENFMRSSIFQTPNRLEILENKTYRKALKEKYRNKYEKAHNAIFEMFGTNDELLLQNRYGIIFKKYDGENECKILIRKIESIQYYLRMLQLNDYTVNNIEEDYNFLKEKYNIKKMEFDNASFKKNQSTYNLHYENDDYEVIVPYSREELHDIGNYFNNCANGYEWDNYLYNGNRYLVVIKNKQNNNMMVCCDMWEKTLRIVQYLGKFNMTIRDTSLLKFKREYQTYLNTLKEG